MYCGEESLRAKKLAHEMMWREYAALMSQNFSS